MYTIGATCISRISDRNARRASAPRPLRAHRASVIRSIRMHPVIQPDMLETVWCAVNRVTKQGTVLGPQERVPVLDALRAVTINAAYQYFEEGSKGSLRPGKRADLVILEEDPLKALPMHLRDIRILETVKDGKTIYRTDI